MSKFLLILVLFIGAAVFLYTVPGRIAGERPQQSFEEAHAGQTSISAAAPESERITRLRSDVNANPENNSARLALAVALLSERQPGQEGNSEVVLEAVDQLRTILETEPNNRGALLVLADISFDQLLFAEAKKYYQKVLEIAFDAEVERRYAMTLSFLGDTEQSLEIFDRQLAETPDSFELHSFKGLSLARSGNDEEATAALTRALELAPNDDARVRIGAFLAMVEGNSEAKISRDTEPTDSQHSKGTPASTTTAPSAKSLSALEQYLVENSVTGPKLVSVDCAEGVCDVQLRNFPIAVMPEFVREKFLANLKEAAAKDQIDKVRIIEADNGEILTEVVVAGS
jgi:tetratricopeptide (TPR) repeat protein